MSSQPLAIVVGAGPGLGQALMRRFEKGGYKAIGFVRSSPSANNDLDIRQLNFSQAEDTKAEIVSLIEKYGPPKVVIHNTAKLVIAPFLETRLSDYEDTWCSMFLSAVTLAQAVIQPMMRGGGGAFLVTGATASLRGGARFSAFASAKFALRGLTQSLAHEYQASGIHVAHFILDGIIDTEASRELHSLDSSRMMKTEDIAENYWHIAHQASSTWSHEIDLRPQSENF